MPSITYRASLDSMMGKKEPVTKLEGFELSPNDASKCCTNGRPFFDTLSQTSSEQINITWGVI